MQSPIAYYSNLLDRHGEYSPAALGWSATSTQQKRFEVLCEVGDLNNASVLDVGAGLGDLLGVLKNRFPSAKYRGIDVNPRFIGSARKRHPDAIFEVCDFTNYHKGRHDYVVASGLLSLKIPNHMRIYQDFIRNMYARARVAAAFNILDREHHVDDETYAAYSIADMFDFCSTFACKVIVRQDYLPYDATFFVYH